MKKVKTLVVMMCLMAVTTMMANPISEHQARTIAARFMANHAMPSTTLKMAIRGPQLSVPNASSSQSAYYVFNGSQAHSGYVIVAGDDRAPAVLGYSDNGTFDANNVPAALQELLDGYAAQIAALSKGGQTVKLQPSGEAISPLVTAAWSQNAPYNTLLPMLPDGKQAVAGCVATAMAQLLYYWKQPVQVTTTLPEYTSQSLGIYMPALEPVDFNWESMQDTYLRNDLDSEGAQAAARLTLYCAQSVKMDYYYGYSGANTNHIPRVLNTYFGFKGSAHCEYRENFNTQSWADYIYNELAEGRPVVYSGSKASGGHAFICDGYDGQGMFHINWGWDGMSNGYYLLNVLNPDAQGTGAASEAYGYIYSQYIVSGIEPGDGAGEFALTSGNVALNGAVTTRASSASSFTATVTGRFYNYTNQSMAVSFGWGLYQGDELVSVLYQSGSSSLPSGYYFSTNNQALNFGQGITSGTYRIVPIYSEFYANNWRPCKGGDVNFIEVTIEGDNCTVTGHGTAGARSYIVNSITHSGSMHHNRPVDLTLNLTNDGYSQNNLLYMHVNGNFNSTGLVGLEHGESGDVPFRFLPTAPGVYTCVFSFNQDGSDPLCQTTLTIAQMPATELSMTYEIQNITDEPNMIITDEKYRLKLTITNNGSETYYDDITVKLYKNLDGTYGSNAQILNQLISLDPDQSTELQFDFDNVINGWAYFAAIYCYSAGQQQFMTSTPYYTINFPEEPDVPEVLLGDVNGDGTVGISDVTLLIDHLLGGAGAPIVEANADVDSDQSITISDVTGLIDMLLGN
jgi:hypothetical protein